MTLPPAEASDRPQQSAGQGAQQHPSGPPPHPSPSLNSEYFSAGSGINNGSGLTGSVMSPVVETPAGIDVSRRFTEDEIR